MRGRESQSFRNSTRMWQHEVWGQTNLGFKSQLGLLTCQLCLTPVNSINLLEARWFHPCSGDGAGMVINKHFWRAYQGQALCCLCILPFFNPLTSLDCWENEIQPHFVFIAPRVALEITKCPINVFCRKKISSRVSHGLRPDSLTEWSLRLLLQWPSASTSGVSEPELMVQIGSLSWSFPFSELHKTS